MRTLWIASDHAGFELKEKLKQAIAGDSELSSQWIVQDVGTHSTESCDYPQFADKLAKAFLGSRGAPSERPLAVELQNRGLLICGTGIGMSIAANKLKGIRAAACSEVFSAEMAASHNAAQILCLGARVLDLPKALACLRAFLGANFDQSNPRHQRRVDQIRALED